MSVDLSEYFNETKTVAASYTTRDLLLYAVGIGCDALRFTYENADEFAAFPTFAIVLPFTGTANDVVDFPSEAMAEGSVMPPLPGTKFLLDGERYLEVLRPLPAEATDVRIRTSLVGVHKKGKGALVETESVIEDAAGSPFVRLRSGAFLVGARDFTDAGRSYSEAVEVPAREPDVVDERATSASQAALYRLSGDYNPLHIDPAMAEMNGFPAPILHGLCTFGFAARAVLEQCANNDPSRFVSIRVRFAKPVFPGQTLVTRMWREQNGTRIIFEVRVKETNQVVINNAYVTLKPTASL